jgi:hypothetical protein
MQWRTSMTDPISIRDDGRATGIIPRLTPLARCSSALLAVLVLSCAAPTNEPLALCDPSACEGGAAPRGCLCAPEGCTGPLELRDPALDRAVRDAAGVAEGELSYADVRDIVELDTSTANLESGPGVIDLEGVECLTGLERLAMNNNDVTDLSPLRALAALEELSLVSTPVADLGPLADLTALEVLDLGNARGLDAPRDLSPLSALQGLRELRIAFGQVSDLAPIAGLESLESLDAEANSIDDVEALAGLSGLRELELGANRIRDVGPLAALSRLELLDLSSNDVTDVAPLVENEGLGEGDLVELSNNPLDCLALLQAEILELLLERGVDVLVDCLSCLLDPTGLDCACWATPDLGACRCHLDPIGCLCEESPQDPECTCYFYPGDPACQD